MVKRMFGRCIIIWLIFLGGCVNRPTSEASPDLEEPQLLTIAPPKVTPKNIAPPQAPLEKGDIELLPAVDLSGKARKDYTSTSLATKELVMEVLSLRDEASTYNAEIQFTNSTATGVTSTLTLHAYDQDGRLIRTQSEVLFFPQGNIITKQFVFSKSSKEVRWVLSLTGK